MNLTLDTVKKLIRVFDRQRDGIPGIEGNVLQGVPAWELQRILGDAVLDRYMPWLNVVGIAGVMECEIEDQLEYVSVERTECSDTLRRRSMKLLLDPFVPVGDAAVYCVNTKLFLPELAGRLHLADFFGGESKELLKDHVWSIGGGVFGSSEHFPVYILRGLDWGQDKILEWLHDRRLHGLLLLCANHLPKFLSWPSGMQAQRLSDVVMGDRLRFEVSVPLLNSHQVNCIPKVDCAFEDIRTTENQRNRVKEKSEIATSSSIKNSRGEILVAYDWENKILSIPGKPDWRLSGSKRQAAIVEYLFKKGESGVWCVSHKELMTATKPLYGGSRHISNIFRDNRDWNRYIVKLSRGEWGFDIQHH